MLCPPLPSEDSELALAIELGHIAVWRYDLAAQRVHLNGHAWQVLAQPPSADGSMPIGEMRALVHPDDLADLIASTDAAVAGRATMTESRCRRSDGSWRHVLIRRGAVQRDAAGNARIVVGVGMDISDKRLAERALRDAAARATLATNSVGLGTWEQEIETGRAQWDAQMWRLRGLAPQARAMTLAERASSIHPDDRARMRALAEAPIGPDATREYEFRVVWPDGSVRWLASRARELIDPGTGRRRRFGVNWDVTDSRSAETARREREVALRESQAKSKFLARMSHELRTPLNAVLGFAQLLLAEDGTGGADPEAATRRRRLEHIRAAGAHLLTLINDVLDLSSLEGGELRIALQPVTLAPLVEQALPLLEGLRASRGIAVHLGALPGSVMADATRLRQVLLNLLSNAIKFNRDGGSVTIESALRGDDVLVRVSDTGRGMSDEQLQHLFEPFNRLGVPGADSGGVDGSGIGLAIVKVLVEHMAGSVHVHSTEGVGSVFELRFLAAAAEAQGEGAVVQAAGADPAPQATPQRGGRVLYVEDNPVNAQIIAELMARRSDLALEIAPDGSSGVALALALRPDLVLLDMQLPDFDGFEVLRRLRADERTAAIPVIALSANAMPDDIHRALRAGMTDYWTKPLDFRAFMASLDSLFGPAPAPAGAGVTPAPAAPSS